MKTRVMTHALALVLGLAAGAIPLAAHADDDNSCSANTVIGKYGIQTSGFSMFHGSPPPALIGNFGPIASVGTFEFRADGTIASSQTANVGGFVFAFTGSGTFTVNPDCTGTFTRTISIGTTETDQFVVVQGGAKILLINTNPGGIVDTGQLERLSPRR